MATVPKRLRARHKIAAMLRAQGRSWPEVAREVKVAVTTAQAWGTSDAFRGLVEQYRAKLIDEAEGILVDAVPRIAREIVTLAEGAESEAARVTAARDVLERAGVRRPSRADQAGTVLRIVVDG